MLTDEQLVERVQKGRSRALDELYRRYARQLYAFCATLTRSSDPEDLVHDVFLRVIESAGTFNPDRASFRTWLFRIARNRCIDVGRRDSLARQISLDAPVNAPHNPDKPTPLRHTLAAEQDTIEDTLIRESETDAVRACIDALRDDDERQALLLYYFMGNVYREIGDILQKSTSTAKNYVTAARDKVKRCLERKGWT